jgi:hypothetical protein
MAQIDKLHVADFYRTTLTASVAPGDESIPVADASGFPQDMAGIEFFYLTLVNELSVHEVVRINSISGNVLSTFAGEGVQNTFSAANTRAEHWFTAEAFRDIQEFLDGLSLTGYPGVDGTTILETTPLEVGVVDSDNIAAGAIDAAHMSASSVATASIQTGAVGNLQISDIDGGKINAGLVLPEFILNLTYANITYTDGGTPIDLPDGSIHFTFKD